MSMDAHSILAPTLPLGCGQDGITNELGEPQDLGRIGKTTLMAYRDKTIQFHIVDNQLFLLAFYIRSAVEQTGWPRCFAALSNFSDVTTPDEVEMWLKRHSINASRIDIDGEQAVATQAGVSFHFQSGRLASIQSISTKKKLPILNEVSS